MVGYLRCVCVSGRAFRLSAGDGPHPPILDSHLDGAAMTDDEEAADGNL